VARLAVYATDALRCASPTAWKIAATSGSRPAVAVRGLSAVRLNVLMAVRSHVLVAASFGPYPVDERTYAEICGRRCRPIRSY